MSWIVIFLLTFFLVNVVRVAMATFGKKLTASDVLNSENITRGQVADAVMEVVERKLFPGLARVYDGIKTKEQLEELVDKIGGALDGRQSVEDAGEVPEEEMIDDILDANKKQD